MFSTTDYLRILLFLDLTREDIPLIKSKLADIETTSPDLVQPIITILDDLDQLESAITCERGSPNYSLIRADVLEWSNTPGSRIRGMLIEKCNLLNKLRILLDIPISITESNNNIFHTLPIEVQW